MSCVRACVRARPVASLPLQEKTLEKSQFLYFIVRVTPPCLALAPAGVIGGGRSTKISANKGLTTLELYT